MNFVKKLQCFAPLSIIMFAMSCETSKNEKPKKVHLPIPKIKKKI